MQLDDVTKTLTNLANKYVEKQESLNELAKSLNTNVNKITEFQVKYTQLIQSEPDKPSRNYDSSLLTLITSTLSYLPNNIPEVNKLPVLSQHNINQLATIKTQANLLKEIFNLDKIEKQLKGSTIFSNNKAFSITSENWIKDNISKQVDKYKANFIKINNNRIDPNKEIVVNKKMLINFKKNAKIA